MWYTVTADVELAALAKAKAVQVAPKRHRKSEEVEEISGEEISSDTGESESGESGDNDADVPSVYHKTRMCTQFLGGGCKQGNECAFAHSKDELLQQGEARDRFLKRKGTMDLTQRKKRKLKDQDDADKDPYYKTQPCPYLMKGSCTSGKSCYFAHSQEELRMSPEMKQMNQTMMMNPMMVWGMNTGGMNPMAMNPMMQMTPDMTGNSGYSSGGLLGGQFVGGAGSSAPRRPPESRQTSSFESRQDSKPVSRPPPRVPPPPPPMGQAKGKGKGKYRDDDINKDDL